MTEEEVRKIIREELSNLIYGDKYVFNRPIQVADGRNIQLGRSNGTKIGTASDQKLGFYGATPIVRQNAISAPLGGITVDGEARTAIVYLIAAIKNIGITN